MVMNYLDKTNRKKISPAKFDMSQNNNKTTSTTQERSENFLSGPIIARKLIFFAKEKSRRAHEK